MGREHQGVMRATDWDEAKRGEGREPIAGQCEGGTMRSKAVLRV